MGASAHASPGVDNDAGVPAVDVAVADRVAAGSWRSSQGRR